MISKKRHAEDFLASDNAKMAKNFHEPSQSTLGTYPNVESQWPASYGQATPAWPMTTQPQTQWNPGYASHVSYIRVLPFSEIMHSLWSCSFG